MPYFYWNHIFGYLHPYFCLWWKSFQFQIFHIRSWIVLTYENSQIDANLLNKSELWIWHDTSMSRFLSTFITRGTILINLLKIVKFVKFAKFAKIAKFAKFAKFLKIFLLRWMYNNFLLSSKIVTFVEKFLRM